MNLSTAQSTGKFWKPLRTQKLQLDLIWPNWKIYCSLKDYRKAVCPWASLSSCVQMRGSVSCQADSSPIPTITVTRHQSVSQHFFAPVHCGPQWLHRNPRSLWTNPVLTRLCPCFSPLLPKPKTCVLNLTTFCSTPCICSYGIECSWKAADYDVTFVVHRKHCHCLLFGWTGVQVKCRFAVLFHFMVLRPSLVVETFCCVIQFWNDGHKCDSQLKTKHN